jgi:hypothetical protein
MIRSDRFEVKRWPNLSFDQKQQGWGQARRPQRDKHGDDPLGPRPPPPIGFQILHDNLARRPLASRKLEWLAFEP